MIKKLLFTALTFCAISISAQNFSVMYPFTAVSTSTAGNTGTVDPTPTPTANGVTFGSFNAIGTPTATSANGVFAFSGWSTGATNADDVVFTGSINTTQYYQVMVSPAVNSTVTLTSITFNMSRSSTGPRNWSVRGSADTYSVNLPATITPSNANISVQTGDKFFWLLDSYTVTGGVQEKGPTITLGAGYTSQTNPMTFRFYPWNAETNVGTFRIDTVTFNGSATVFVGLNKVTTDLNSKFTLYPNPSNDGLVSIEAKGNFNKVEVINLLGAVVATQNGILADKIKIDLGTLPEGTYFVRVSNAEKVTTEKLIITR